jgi:hypothetical protein
MSKLFDKMLYYFGYAPIKISHEVKFSHVVKEGNVKIYRELIEIDELDYYYRVDSEVNRIKEDRRLKINLLKKLINSLDESGLINYTSVHSHHVSSGLKTITAELYVVDINKKNGFK